MKSHEAKALLLAKKEELARRVAAVEADIRRQKDPLVQDAADQAIQKENDAVLDALDAEIRAELRDIEHALERIEMGNYHICSHCGATISEERHAALPYTTVCVHCANKL